MYKFLSTYCLMIICFNGHLIAQEPDSLNERVLKKDLSFVNDGPAPVSYYYPFQNSREISFSDTLINSSFFQFDPSRTNMIQHAHLGNAGAPALPFEFSLKDKFGTRTGFDAYDLYTLDANDIRFFKSTKAFTDLYYSQGNEQNDHLFRGSLGRTFNNGYSISVEHQRLIHSLEDEDLPLNTNAFFPYLGAKNTNLKVGIAYAPKQKKYNAYLGFIHNEVLQNQHGGIVNEASIFDVIMNADTLEDSYTIPVELSESEAQTRYAIRELKYLQSFDLLKAKDSTDLVKNRIKFNHSISWSWNNYKFSETAPDSSYYQSFFEDNRGIRLFLKTQNLENHASFSWELNKSDSLQASNIEIGLRHGAFKIKQEYQDSLVQNLYAEGRWKSNLFDIVNLNIFGQIGLLDNAGDFRINAEAALLTNKLGELTAVLIQQRYSPDVLFNQLYLSQKRHWTNDFNKSFDSELRFKYELPSFKLSAQLSYFLLDNYLYFNEEIEPSQFTGAINILQLKVKKDFKVGILRMENQFTFQNSTEKDITNLPLWSSRHSLAIQGKLFKKVLDTRFGLDLRLNETFYANSFFPLLSKFYVQRKQEVKLYPALDAHLSFRVDSFRFFLKMENLTALFSDEIYYQIPFYPQKETSIRFGIGWQFYDRHKG